MAIVTQENQKLYLRSWEFNAARVLSRLAEKVVELGGRIRPTKTAVIVNRALEESVREVESKIALYGRHIESGLGNPDKLRAALKYQSKQLSELNSISHDAIAVTHTNYISFVLGSTYFYYQTNDNPFFPPLYVKTPVSNGERSRDAVLEEDKKSWLEDVYLGFPCTDDDVNRAADAILKTLLNAENCIIRPDCKRVRVPNTYDGGWHWENRYPERKEKIDF